MRALKSSMQSNVGTANVNIFTCPASNTATIVGMTVANRANVEITVDVYLRDNSNANSQTYVVKGATIRAGGALIPIDKNALVVLEAGDKLDVISSANNSADVIMSRFELSV